ncbi:MAG: hypothetical protein ACYDDF_04040 [Thermoplasmatota archaeon]
MKAILSLLLTSLMLAGCMGATGQGLLPFGMGGGSLAISVQEAASGLETFSAPSGIGYSYTWDFGDFSKLAPGDTVQHQYGVKNGHFVVVLAAKGASGAVTYLTKDITIGTGADPTPMAMFTVDNAMIATGSPVTVDGSGSSDADGNALSSEWILAAPGVENTSLPDSGMISPGSVQAVRYDAAGMYQVHCRLHPWMLADVYTTGNAASADVTIVGNTFVPSVVTIRPGGSVTFHNSDGVTHDAVGVAFVPSGQILPLTQLSGTVSIVKTGASDLVLAVANGKGRWATAILPVTVENQVPPASEELRFNGSFATNGLPIAAKPTPQNISLRFAYAGAAEIVSNDSNATPNVPPSYGNVTFSLLDPTGHAVAHGKMIFVPVSAGTYILNVAPNDPVVANLGWSSIVAYFADTSATSMPGPTDSVPT